MIQSLNFKVKYWRSLMTSSWKIKLRQRYHKVYRQLFKVLSKNHSFKTILKALKTWLSHQRLKKGKLMKD